uniref:cellulose 1,4-beta-cellobiosidase (non-reducing end) n=1 Tax=uncultured eukaryote TaxID=100272 RepID=G8YZT2_9EUKA|nr:putative glycoside hydrolase family 7 [uncultured eukaryote]
MELTLLTLLSLACLANGQGVGSFSQEVHLPLPMQSCTSSGCATQTTSVVLDSNWRWLHANNDYTNCYTGNTWNQQLCPNAQTCTANCALEGIDQGQWASTYGISVSGNSLRLNFVTPNSNGKNVGSRVYLMVSDTRYYMFQLKNREFAVTIDSSRLVCGLNGALYFVEMEADGGMASFPTNRAGAKYGTGYCDAQCPHDMKFISGQANSEGWVPSSSDPNSGSGRYGACCMEMDIWEASSISQAYTPHPCTVNRYTRCDGVQCGDNGGDRYRGVCDKDGCDFATYRQNQRNFYGPGGTVNSNQPVTVITQFLTTTGTDAGDLSEIRRIYIQNGQTIRNSPVNLPGITAYDSITNAFCTATKNLYGDTQDFTAKGGLKAMGDSLQRGHVLALSLWDDHYANMHWLDSNYPTNGNPATPGVARGTCPITGGKPADVEAQSPNAYVVFSNIRVGTIGSTYAGLDY